MVSVADKLHPGLIQLSKERCTRFLGPVLQGRVELASPLMSSIADCTARQIFYPATGAGWLQSPSDHEVLAHCGPGEADGTAGLVDEHQVVRGLEGEVRVG